MKKISIISGCYNEEDNVVQLSSVIRKIMEEELPQYEYEHVFIDNCSQDNTLTLLREICATDKHVKVIENARNFGPIRSPFYGLLNTSGDCSIFMASDFQDPPSLIPAFIKKWEEGYKVVCAVKTTSKENRMMYHIRKIYYKIVKKISEVDSVDNFTGFGLYDKQVIAALRLMDDPYPYFRGLVSEIGFRRAEVEFVQERRRHGRSNNDFFTLYDMAMTGFVNHSKLPLRLATLTGFVIGTISFVTAMAYLVFKLCMWDTFQFGLAPLMIGMFFLASVQLIFIGIIGEYLGAVWTQVRNRPLVVVEERINFAPEPPPAGNSAD